MASTSFTLPKSFTGRKFSAGSPPYQQSSRLAFRISAGYATAERSSETSLNTASFYDVLGIQTGATCQEIKSAYRKLARVLHPDVTSNGRDDGTSSSADDFMRVHVAYATLSDPDQRAVYDSSIFRRTQRTGTLSASGFTGTSQRRRNWETDQCW